jgi:hypothetical protein
VVYSCDEDSEDDWNDDGESEDDWDDGGSIDDWNGHLSRPKQADNLIVRVRVRIYFKNFFESFLDNISSSSIHGLVDVPSIGHRINLFWDYHCQKQLKIHQMAIVEKGNGCNQSLFLI